jgi:hypothetical protein
MVDAIYKDEYTNGNEKYKWFVEYTITFIVFNVIAMINMTLNKIIWLNKTDILIIYINRY